jgi:hypothetical protein
MRGKAEFGWDECDVLKAGGTTIARDRRRLMTSVHPTLGNPGEVRTAGRRFSKARVCPACRHYLRFDHGAEVPQAPHRRRCASKAASGIPPTANPEYTVVVDRNDRGEEIAQGCRRRMN